MQRNLRLTLVPALLLFCLFATLVPHGVARACHSQPIELSAALDGTTVTLRWSPPDYYPGKTFMGQYVYRYDIALGAEVNVTSQLVQGGTYTDLTAQPGRAYYYYVRALFDDGLSEASNKVKVTIPGTPTTTPTPPPGGGGTTLVNPPRNLTATLANGGVLLTWEPPDGGTGIIGYYIYRGDAAKGFSQYPLNDFTTPAHQWNDATVQAGVTYFYYVTAVAADNSQSKPSNKVQIATAGRVVVLTIDSSTAVVNGQNVPLDQPATLVNGRTMLPFRFVAENMGAEVTWDPDTQQVTATYGTTVVRLMVGSQTAYVNGQATEVNVPPQLVNGRTMVPLRFLADAFGWQPHWDNLTRTVTVQIPD